MPVCLAFVAPVAAILAVRLPRSIQTRWSRTPFAGGNRRDPLVDPEFSDTLDEWFQEGLAPYRSQEEFRNWGEYYDYIRKFDIRSLNGETVHSFPLYPPGNTDGLGHRSNPL